MKALLVLLLYLKDAGLWNDSLREHLVGVVKDVSGVLDPVLVLQCSDETVLKECKQVCKVLYSAVPLGQEGAIQKGIGFGMETGYDFFVVMDGDVSHSGRNAVKVWECYQREDVDHVLAKRDRIVLPGEDEGLRKYLELANNCVFLLLHFSDQMAVVRKNVPDISNGLFGLSKGLVERTGLLEWDRQGSIFYRLFFHAQKEGVRYGQPCVRLLDSLPSVTSAEEQVRKVKETGWFEGVDEGMAVEGWRLMQELYPEYVEEDVEGYRERVFGLQRAFY